MWRAGAAARRSTEPAAVRRDDYAPMGPAGHGTVAGEQADRALLLLEQRAPLQLPFDWEVPSLEVSRPLAELEVHYLDWLHALDDQDFGRRGGHGARRIRGRRPGSRTSPRTQRGAQPGQGPSQIVPYSGS